MMCRIRDGIIYWIATPSAMARNDKSVVGTCSYLVIARKHRDRGDPVCKDAALS